ncbi:MAG TPA: uroporphyrinogen decarboxylase [Ktedonobacterales bacterium]|jgi:uroporphyrinogen decarboxylase
MSEAAQSPTTENSRFLRACWREAVDTTPIWLMRQAGRYMPEYRQLREKHSLLELIKTPELACEVTLQPVNVFALDAAIIFADILPPLEGMGLDLAFAAGEGPVIGNPVRTAADIARLRTPPPEEALAFTLEAIRLVRAELDTRGLPLIGFSGAPFTLAAYAVEGGGSRNFERVKALMMGEPDLWKQLMTKLNEVVGAYLLAQARAGAQALQVFDSWAGQLAPGDYREYVAPYTRRAIETAREAGVPIIHFGVNTSGMLEEMRDAGGDVIGVDWRIELTDARRRLGDGVTLQGNLDPVALLASWESLRPRAQHILDQIAGRAGYIFNLGHGVLPQTPVENIARLVEFVHEYPASGDAHAD